MFGEFIYAKCRVFDFLSPLYSVEAFLIPAPIVCSNYVKFLLYTNLISAHPIVVHQTFAGNFNNVEFLVYVVAGLLRGGRFLVRRSCSWLLWPCHGFLKVGRKLSWRSWNIRIMEGITLIGKLLGAEILKRKSLERRTMSFKGIVSSYIRLECVVW